MSHRFDCLVVVMVMMCFHYNHIYRSFQMRILIIPLIHGDY